MINQTRLAELNWSIEICYKLKKQIQTEPFNVHIDITTA